MPEENTDESFRELALRLSREEERKRKTDLDETHERSIIILGSKGVGKTTMIYRFLEKEENPKPTIAMDYSFGRKAGKSLVKDIVHVWELGHLSSSLLSSAMTGSASMHSPGHLTLILVLNLARPEVLWSTLEESLSTIKSAAKISYDDKRMQLLRTQRLSERRKDLDKIDPFPLRLCIVGSRYDEFKEFDIDKKQLIGRTLRGVAHILGAHLQFHSAKDTTLVRKTKEMLTYFAFGGFTMKGNCTDYDKPLLIQSGTDSFAQMDLRFPHTKSMNLMDTIKHTFVAQIPQGHGHEDEAKPEDPANDPNFLEPIVDRSRAQREEEISIQLKDMMDGRTSKIPIPEPF